MTPAKSNTAANRSPNDEQSPDDIAWVTRHWKGLASMATVLASAGYLVVSPGQRIDKLADQISRAADVQTLRDRSQDERLDRLQDLTDTGLRDVREDIRDLILAQCLQSSQTMVRARLKCTARLSGER